jgi:hypothetical protein
MKSIIIQSLAILLFGGTLFTASASSDFYQSKKGVLINFQDDNLMEITMDPTRNDMSPFLIHSQNGINDASYFDTDTSISNNTFGYERFAGNTFFVQALNGLKLRHEPTFNSQVITVLDYGEVVTYLGDTPESTPFKVGYATGKWVHVDVNGLEGYVFDGFISRLPLPEVLPHTDYLTSVLEQYAHTNFNLITADTIERSSEMDERFHVKYKFDFEGGVRLHYDAYWQSELMKLEFPDIRIMDAYHLVNALLTVSDLKSIYGENLIFKINDEGQIYEISDRLRENIIIKSHLNNTVTIEFITYVGC